jgi:competence ComEA-like helix-hairpin-helix protein
MRKEYHFTLSRTDRICLVVFVVVLLAWELIKELMPQYNSTYEYIPGQKKTEYRKTYKEYDNRKNYTREYARKKYYPGNKRSYQSHVEDIPLTPDEPLDITSASISQLISIGFTRKVAYNIQKYLAAGGVIDEPGDLMKIYDMDSVQLMKATSYLIFPDKKIGENVRTSSEIISGTSVPGLDLNKASSSELDQLPGIGPVLAERIIKFRESLGGFTSPDQLKDCYGLPPEVFEKIRPRLHATGTITPLRINEIDLVLNPHPYINKKLGKIIEAYKSHHGPFRNSADLRKVYPSDTTWCNKVLPYISFEERNGVDVSESD